MLKSVLIGLIGCFLLGSGLATANTFSHNYPRIVLTSSSYPWRAIGKMTETTTATTGCTAFLVGPRLIMTNRHCIEGNNNSIKKRQYYFYLKLHGNIFATASYVAYPVAWGVDGLSKNDWSILELDTNLGEKYGFFGIDSGEKYLAGFSGEEIVQPRPYEKNLCAETASPFEFLKFEGEGELTENWMVDRKKPDIPLLCMAGYPGDLGGKNLVLSNHCSQLGVENSRWIHDCSSTRGSSGSPLFYRKGDDYFVTALNIGGVRTDDDSLLDVEFGALNANHAVKTSVMINSIQSLRASDPRKLRLQNTPGDSCSSNILHSLKSESLVDEKLNWRLSIWNQLKSGIKFQHPSKNEMVPGVLVVGANSMSLVNPYTQETHSLTSLSQCELNEKQILEFLSRQQE